jgi:hypothetical protein
MPNVNSNSVEMRLPVAQRRDKAVQLRIEGKTWREVAEACGYPSAPTAQKDFVVALEQANKQLDQSIGHLRRTEAARLDDLIRKAYAILTSEHLLVQGGKVVLDADGNPMHDDGPKLKAIDLLRRLSESRRKLFGLDAPEQHQIAIGVVHTLNGIDLDDLS